MRPAGQPDRPSVAVGFRRLVAPDVGHRARIRSELSPACDPITPAAVTITSARFPPQAEVAVRSTHDRFVEAPLAVWTAGLGRERTLTLCAEADVPLATQPSRRHSCRRSPEADFRQKSGNFSSGWIADR